MPPTKTTHKSKKMPKAPKVAVSKRAVREWFTVKYGFFPRVPKDREAKFYEELSRDYLTANKEAIEEKSEALKTKRKQYYQSRKAKKLQEQAEANAVANAERANIINKAATVIQQRFKKYMNSKYNFSIQYEHALKKTVEQYKFGFSKEATFDQMVENKYAFKEAELPKSLQMVVKYSTGISREITKIIQERVPTKIAFTTAALYETPGAKAGESLFIKYLHSTHEVVLHESEIGPKVKDISSEVDSQIENTDSKRFKGFLGVVFRAMKYMPIGGSSYFELPEFLNKKKALINIKNEDNNCFVYSLMCGIMEITHHAERVSHYKNKMDVIKVPPSASVPPGYHDYKKFEQLNDITISVFYVNTKAPETITPFYISTYKSSSQRKVDLLLVENDSTGQKHYVVIKSLSRLLSSGISKDSHKMHFCRHCLSHFPSEARLQEHMELDCQSNDAVKVQLPKNDEARMEFNNMHKKIRAPYVIYADCESILTQQQVGEGATKKYQKHLPISFRYTIVDFRKHATTKYFVGENATEQFINALIEDAAQIQSTVRDTNLPMAPLSDEQASTHKKARVCYLCDKAFTQANFKCADHDHLTGSYRGPACQSCNHKARNDRVNVSVFFHNGKGYDFHHIISHIGKVADEKKLNLDCIPLNTEKYLTLAVKNKDCNVMFKDSMQFMAGSIEKLVETIKKSGYSFELTKQHFQSQGFNDEQIGLIIQKGFFPYEWFDNVQKLSYVGLPPQSAFYSKLSGKDISDEDYAHAQKVYTQLGCKSFRDYHDLYLACDVFLLADCFEYFRELCLQHFQLDPAHYFTNPGMFWDAALMKSKVKLELLTEIDMVLMFEKQARGGISMISQRHAAANNPLLESYDPSKPESYIMYVDANNLYGWAMSKHLPTGGFKWEDPAAYTEQNIMSYDLAGNRGCILMVDLEYPAELHDEHNAYPLAPEKMTVTADMASPYNVAVSQANDIKLGDCEKLVPNLMDKHAYVCHIANLQLYMSLGLKLKKVHKVISFDQSPWLKGYIDYNTRQRAEAKRIKNAFLADLYKLANNAVFGKTMENVRKRTNLDLVSKADKFLMKKLSSPRIQHVTIFNEDLMCIQMRKSSVTINKPIYVGMCILDLSKTLMYDFHYNTMLQMYGHENCNLLFTDTDSLCYHITTTDLYGGLAEIKGQFDFSEYDANHALYCTTNQAVIGKFKDETAGKPIAEFVGLKPKMYSFVCGGKDKSVAKGVSKSIKLAFQQYKTTLADRTTTKVTQHSLRSYKHQIFTVEQTKLGLSPIDTKRYVMDNGIDTLAYGHYKIIRD